MEGLPLHLIQFHYLFAVGLSGIAILTGAAGAGALGCASAQATARRHDEGESRVDVLMLQKDAVWDVNGWMDGRVKEEEMVATIGL